MDTYSWGLVIFTDGASRGNPGPGGSAALCIDTQRGFVDEYGQAFSHTTNNETELAALVLVFESILLSKSTRASQPVQLPETIDIYMDSRYVYQGVTRWMYGWQRAGWIKKDKTGVLNKSWWERLFVCVEELAKEFRLRWHHVPGHSAIAGNERVDILATQYADGKNPELFHGSLAQYPHPHILDIPSDAELEKLRDMRSKSKAQKTASALYYISLLDGVLMRHETWASCEARVKGVRGARYKKVTQPHEEQDILRQWGVT